VTAPDAIPEAGQRLRTYLENRYHGTMDWMETRVEERANPSVLWPEVRSIVLLGMSYAPGFDPLETLAKPDTGTISIYARSRDYHEIIKGRLKTIAHYLIHRAGLETDSASQGVTETGLSISASFSRSDTVPVSASPPSVKVFVDTAPVMEKALAASAGLGWQGKHTVLVSREHGNWLFLGAIYTTLELPPDAAGKDHCGSCTRCLSACPTEAFPAPYQLDARRCIAYLTIEHKGPIDRALRPLMGNRIFGCDDCLAVCPWNRFAVQTREIKLAAQEIFREPKLADLVRLDDAAFRKLFAGTPVKRTGRDRFIRNVLIAIGNSGRTELAQEAERLLEDASPLVRGAAIWALSRLLSRDDFDALLIEHKDHESDAGVRVEWEEGRSAA
jgi:epoxyqueuosine reductase